MKLTLTLTDTGVVLDEWTIGEDPYGDYDVFEAVCREIHGASSTHKKIRAALDDAYAEEEQREGR